MEEHMSWSVSRNGKASEVAGQVQQDINSAQCNEPEQSIKAAVGQALALAIGAFPPDQNVKVSAYGSQSASGDHWINSLSVTLATA
jgi:hypothetical protein